MSEPTRECAGLTLAKEFPPVPTSAWNAAIANDSKVPVDNDKLVWRSEEGLAMGPYFRSEHWSGHAQLRPAGRWQIAQDACPNPDAIRADWLHEAGAHAVQELGYALAAGVERLTTRTKTQSLEAAASSIEFVFAVGPTFFLEIAKFRAARRLWAHAVSAFGGASAEARRMKLSVRTARRNKSRFDCEANLLRVTTEALSAILGGCDQLTVEPFGFEAHLAHNVQRLLQEECHLDAVADPAGGSYYIEVLTDSLAREGWKLFQQVEAAGGYESMVANGAVGNALAEARAAREEAFAARRRILVGVNNYPHLAQEAPAAEPRADSNASERSPFPQSRLAEPFEKIRMRTVSHALATGKVPRVLLLQRGDAKMKNARAAFCSNFFGCAGFDMVEGEELRNDVDLVVLCSSDPEYLAFANEVCAKTDLPVLVAGRPKAAMESLQAAGVQGFVHMQSDAMETLTEWQDRLGIGCGQTLHRPEERR